MRLLELLDSDGRITDANAQGGRRVFGVPGPVLRGLLQHAFRCVLALGRRKDADAFYHENRARFLLSYALERIKERWNQNRADKSRAAALPRTQL